MVAGVIRVDKTQIKDRVSPSHSFSHQHFNGNNLSVIRETNLVVHNRVSIRQERQIKIKLQGAMDFTIALIRACNGGRGFISAKLHPKTVIVSPISSHKLYPPIRPDQYQ